MPKLNELPGKFLLLGMVATFILCLPSFTLAAKTTIAEPIDTAETESYSLDAISQETAENIAALASDGIATLTIFADPTSSTIGSSGLSYDLGTHAFITVKNISTANITVGRLSGIAPGKTVSVGTWGNKSEHKGLWYNLESYFVYKNSAYSGRVSYSLTLTSTTLDSLTAYIKSNDYWSNTTNCSSFAAGAWNSAAGSTDKISAGIPNTPKKLANNIKSKWPTQYKTGLSVPYNYVVYYAQGSGAPLKSAVYK
jgi:hypothetical protein